MPNSVYSSVYNRHQNMIEKKSSRAEHHPQIAIHQPNHTKCLQTQKQANEEVYPFDCRPYEEVSRPDQDSTPPGTDISVILHFGRVHLLPSYNHLLNKVSQYGKILESQEVSDDEKKSLRVNLATSAALIRKLRQEVSSLFPMIRVKQISSSESYRKKVYLKIHLSHTKAALVDYFSQFGEVKKVELKYDPKSKVPRNFCYLTFSKTESVVKACLLKEHLVCSKIVYCQPYRQYQIQGSEDPGTRMLPDSGNTFPESQSVPPNYVSSEESGSRQPYVSDSFHDAWNVMSHEQTAGSPANTFHQHAKLTPATLHRDLPRTTEWGELAMNPRCEIAASNSGSGSTQHLSTSPQLFSPLVIGRRLQQTTADLIKVSQSLASAPHHASYARPEVRSEER